MVAILAVVGEIYYKNVLFGPDTIRGPFCLPIEVIAQRFVFWG